MLKILSIRPWAVKSDKKKCYGVSRMFGSMQKRQQRRPASKRSFRILARWGQRLWNSRENHRCVRDTAPRQSLTNQKRELGPADFRYDENWLPGHDSEDGQRRSGVTCLLSHSRVRRRAFHVLQPSLPFDSPAKLLGLDFYSHFQCAGWKAPPDIWLPLLVIDGFVPHFDIAPLNCCSLRCVNPAQPSAI